MLALELMVKLGLDSSEFNKDLDESKEKAEGFGDFLKKGLATAAKVTATALTAVSGAVIAITKQAVDAYAEYEQLEGGIKKLYGNMGMSLEQYAENSGKSIEEVSDEWYRLEEAQTQVLNNARNAYKTSGMSMNEYMQTATSFSASLIKSLNGDTVEAARITDMAMTAMSDNVNTFGTDAEMVKNAFMGLSRQNYMMIDNLKLGYAGTAQGMLELINDSGVLGKKLTDTSQLADVGFGKMIEAIQAVQEKQNIAGTTAREAATTISGSVGMMKSAWENLLIGLGDSESNVTELMSNVMDSAVTVVKNIVPVAQRVFSSLGTLVTESLPSAFSRIPELLKELVPGLVDTVMSTMNLLKDTIVEAFPVFMEAGIELIQNLGQGLVEGIPAFLEQALPMLLSFTDYLRENFGLLVDAGIGLIENLTQGLLNALPTLWEYLPQIISNIAGLINDNAPKLIGTGLGLIWNLIKGVIQSIPLILDNFGNVVQMAVDVFLAFNWINLGKQIIDFIASGIKALISNVPDLLKNIGKSGWDAVKAIDWSGLGSQLINLIGSGITALKTLVADKLVGIGEDAWNALKNIDWAGVGQSIIDGVVKGLSWAGGAIKDKLISLGEKAWQGVKDFFGIKSPSRLMRDTVGKMIPLGMAEGIEDETDAVTKAMDDLSNLAFDDISVKANADGTDTGSYGGYSQTVNIYSPTQLNPSEVARQTKNATRDMVLAFRGV